MIHCKSPAMSRKALWANLLGYNLVRKVAAQAAWTKGLTPRQISFAGTRADPGGIFLDLDCRRQREQRASMYSELFAAIATHQVGDRPDRIDPHRLKRRHDKYQHLQRMPSRSGSGRRDQRPRG